VGEGALRATSTTRPVRENRSAFVIWEIHIGFFLFGVYFLYDTRTRSRGSFICSKRFN
jgi:hypothetical protein